MTKFDKIREKKKTAKIIKDAKNQGRIKEKVEPIVRNVISYDEPKWFSSEDNDETKWVYSTGNDNTIYSTGNDGWISNISGTIGNNVIYPILEDDHQDIRGIEQKLEQIHEDMAELRKYTGKLENQITSLTEITAKTIHEKNRLKKEVKDQKEEMQEYLQKYGEIFRFMKEKITDVKREQSQRASKSGKKDLLQ